MRVRHQLGEWRKISFNFSPLFDESEKSKGVGASGRRRNGLSGWKNTLIQAEKTRRHGSMLAGAHELNKSLTAIPVFTELVREREGLDES